MHALELAEIILSIEDHEYVDPDPDDVLLILARRWLHFGLSPNIIFNFLVGSEENAGRRGLALG